MNEEMTPEKIRQIKQKTVDLIQECIEKLTPEAVINNPAYDKLRDAVISLAAAKTAITLDMERERVAINATGNLAEEFKSTSWDKP